MKTTRLLFLALLCAALPAFGQGSLTPPGSPGPTFKTLTQVEPRTPIASLPFTISAPGSYYLTTNLTGSTGISIRSSHVSLDLNGFAVTGSGAGSGTDGIDLGTNSSIR